MRKIAINSLLLLCFSFFVIGHKVNATENENLSFDFSVEPLLSDKQIDKEQRYFDLRLSPDEVEIIHLKIINQSDSDNIYQVNINQAYTSKNGFIEYIPTEEIMVKDESLQYHIDDIVTYDDLVMVPANSEKIIPITISMPPNEFLGIISSGIIVEKFEDSTDSDNKEIKSLVINKVNYVIGLTLSEKDDVLEREIVLNRVYPDLSFGKTSIVANLSNPKMASYGNLAYRASVINLDNNKEFIFQEYEGMEFAPNSLYNFVIDANDKALVPGNYKLKLDIKDKKGNNWNFDEPFEITKQEAERINKAALVQNRSVNKLLFVCLGILSASLLFVVIICFERKRQHHKIKQDR